MKKFLIFIITLFVCVICRADTFYQHWYVEDNAPIQTTCTTGGDIILPTPPTKYGYDFIGWEQLPYVRIEYLESTGTQWIDTGYKPNNTTVVKSKAYATSYNGAFCECRWTEEPTYDSFGVTIGSAGNILAYFGDYSRNEFYRGEVINLDAAYDYELGINEFVFNGTSRPITRSTFNSPINMFLGANNRGTIVKTQLSGRLYPVKIYDNDILVRDFIPVLDKNLTPCMYDLVEGKFYYNAGTGQFIAGPVIGE